MLSKNSVAVNDKYFYTAFQKPILPIKTAVLTPNALLLEGLKTWLQTENVIDIIYAEKNPFDWIFHWQNEKKSTWPSLFLIDAHLKNMDCIEVIQRLKYLNHHCKILVMGDDTNEQVTQEFFEARASGYIHLAVKQSCWIEAIYTVSTKRPFLWTP